MSETTHLDPPSESKPDELQSPIADPDADELQAAIAAKLDRPINSEPVRRATSQASAAGFSSADVAAVRFPGWWTDPPTPEQLLDSLEVARAKAEAAEAKRRKKEADQARARDQAAAEREDVGAELRRIDEARADFFDLPESERRRRIGAKPTDSPGVVDMKTDVAIAAFAEEIAVCPQSQK